MVGRVSWDGLLARGLMPVFWSGVISSLSEGSTVSSSRFWGVYGFSMALGSLSANVQHCVPVSLKNWCGYLGTGACWLLGGPGFGVETKTFGKALIY